MRLGCNERLDSLEKRGRLSAFWIEHCVTLHSPTSVHFHGFSKGFWVCHCLDSLWMCLPHFSSAQYLVTPFWCHFSVHLQTAPLLISNTPWARSDFSGLGLYSPCFCLGLTFPLYFCRVWATIDGEVASFLIFTISTSSVDHCVHSINKIQTQPPYFSFNVFLLLFPIHMKLSFNAVTWIVSNLPYCQVCGWVRLCFKNSFTI